MFKNEITMKRTAFTILLLLQYVHGFSQVVINEIMVKPSGGDLDQVFQSLYNSVSTSGSEYIEIYNTSSCDAVDISCWSLGGMDGGTNGGAFSFPSGTVIPPLGFMTIGGPNTVNITFNLNLVANSARLWRSNASRWHLPNGDGWVALYDATGVAVDAVYWTFASNDPTKLTTDATFTTGALQRVAVCGGGGLATASTIPGIEYISQATVTGQSYERTTDGGSTWGLATATPNACNGICAISAQFPLNATIVQPSCGNNNGSITFAPTPAGTYFYTWPFPSTSTTSSVSNLAPGTYPVTITNLGGCSVDTTIVLTNIPCGNTCNPAGNLMIYSNYDGGILTINVDQNIPNLKVGICTYEPIQVTFTGPFVGNITQVIYAGMNSSQNNNNCGLGNFTTSITGVPAGIVTISPPMNPPQVGYTPAHGNGSGPWGGGMLGVAGLCDTTVNAGGGNTPDEVVYYFLNATSGILLAHQTQYACWVNQTLNVSAGGNCCILPSVSNPCANPITPSFTQVAPICSGGAFTLPTSSNNGITGVWSPAINNTTTTTYTFTPTAGQCANTTTMTVNVNPSVTPTFTTWGPYCQNDILIQVILPTTSNEGITGTWNPAMVSTAVSGNIVHTFTPNPGQCANSTTMTVVVNPISTPQFNPIPAICTGEAINLPSSSINGILGTWSPAINNVATTTYTFSPNSGQCANSATMTVIVNPANTPQFNPIQTICEGDPINLPASSTNGISGTWSPAINNTATTTYTFTPNPGQCATSTNLTVQVNAAPVVNVVPSNSTIDLGDFVQLLASGANSYSWSNASTLSCFTCPNPVATPTTSTTYIVTGTDANGCTGIATANVNVIQPPVQCGDIFVPTVLSPNGTGVVANKTICVYGGCVSEIIFAIYNRWGEKVFETTDANLTECWDGTYKGKALNAGTFVYKLILTRTNNEFIEESGNITLVR
jgi:gliding motility-associated-like protein